MSMLPLAENTTARPHAKDVAGRQDSKKKLYRTHSAGLRPPRHKVAIRWHCPCALRA
jgi:hypothetical protein